MAEALSSMYRLPECALPARAAAVPSDALRNAHPAAPDSNPEFWMDSTRAICEACEVPPELLLTVSFTVKLPAAL